MFLDKFDRLRLLEEYKKERIESLFEKALSISKNIKILNFTKSEEGIFKGWIPKMANKQKELACDLKVSEAFVSQRLKSAIEKLFFLVLLSELKPHDIEFLFENLGCSWRNSFLFRLICLLKYKSKEASLIKERFLPYQRFILSLAKNYFNLYRESKKFDLFCIAYHAFVMAILMRDEGGQIEKHILGMRENFSDDFVINEAISSVIHLCNSQVLWLEEKNRLIFKTKDKGYTKRFANLSLIYFASCSQKEMDKIIIQDANYSPYSADFKKPVKGFYHRACNERYLKSVKLLEINFLRLYLYLSGTGDTILSSNGLLCIEFLSKRLLKKRTSDNIKEIIKNLLKTFSGGG